MTSETQSTTMAEENIPSENVYFVHISDTHFGTDRAYARHGYASYPCAVELVKHINELPIRPDFVIHTGDVVTNPEVEAYKIAAEVLGELEVPVYYAVGNHDRAAGILAHLDIGKRQALLGEPEFLSYRFVVKGYEFLVIDARAPDEMDPNGLISDDQLEVVRAAAIPDGPPLTVFLHYPALPLNAPWFDKNLLIVNGELLHEAFLPARDRLRGVFHGHAHMPYQTVRDGIVYCGAPSSFANFEAWPRQPGIGIAADPPGYGFVHLMPNQTIIHQQTIPRPV